MWTKVIQHPFLWWNCLINIGYYVGEVLLYQEAFGLVFLVLASLTSSFCVAPLEGMFGIVDSTVPLAVLLLVSRLIESLYIFIQNSLTFCYKLCSRVFLVPCYVY